MLLSFSFPPLTYCSLLSTDTTFVNFTGVWAWVVNSVVLCFVEHLFDDFHVPVEVDTVTPYGVLRFLLTNSADVLSTFRTKVPEPPTT